MDIWLQWLLIFITVFGVVGFFSRNKISAMLAKPGSALGLNYTLSIGIITLIAIFVGGGALTVGAIQNGLSKVNLSPANIAGEDNLVSASEIALECDRQTAGSSVTASLGNFTFRSDPSDNSHTWIDLDNATDAPDASINGTLLCSRSGSTIEGATVECVVKSEAFGSETSTTDLSVYHIVAETKAKSKVPGYVNRQTAYLNDGAVATASSSQEKVFLGFDDNEATEELGYFFTLPGDTIFNYLNQQSSADIVVECGGKTVHTFTVTKI